MIGVTERPATDGNPNLKIRLENFQRSDALHQVFSILTGGFNLESIGIDRCESETFPLRQCVILEEVSCCTDSLNVRVKPIRDLFGQKAVARPLRQTPRFIVTDDFVNPLAGAARRAVDLFVTTKRFSGSTEAKPSMNKHNVVSRVHWYALGTANIEWTFVVCRPIHSPTWIAV